MKKLSKNLFSVLLIANVAFANCDFYYEQNGTQLVGGCDGNYQPLQRSNQKLYFAETNQLVPEQLQLAYFTWKKSKKELQKNLKSQSDTFQCGN